MHPGLVSSLPGPRPWSRRVPAGGAREPLPPNREARRLPGPADPATLAVIARLGQRVVFPEGSLVGQPELPCRHLYLILKGQVLISRMSEGRPRATELLGPGSLFGEEALRPEQQWSATARVVVAGYGIALPGRSLPVLGAASTEVTATLIGLLARRLSRAALYTELTAMHGAAERLERFLTALAEDYGRPESGGVRVHLALNQAELSQILGLSRETITRAFAKLESEGTVRRLRRTELLLLDAR